MKKVIMAPYETKTFKSGKGVALRLPNAFDIAPGTPMTIERHGDVLTLRARVVRDPAEEKRKLLKLVEDLEAIGRPGEVQKRDPFEFPERPGLY